MAIGLPARGKFMAASAKLDFSKEIFTAGFADPNLWSNHAWATDVGLNWYLNFYTRVFLDWQHSEFGNPVVIAPNRLGRRVTCTGSGSRSSSEPGCRT